MHRPPRKSPFLIFDQERQTIPVFVGRAAASNPLVLSLPCVAFGELALRAT
jgi:hypothetical protein